MTTPLTDEQLADAVPATAIVIEKEGERNRVAMTRAELHEFARALLATQAQGQDAAPAEQPQEACNFCGGSGVDPDSSILAECCRNPNDWGECCGNPVPSLSIYPCRGCAARAKGWP
jgi:hypothetical protein